MSSDELLAHQSDLADPDVYLSKDYMQVPTTVEIFRNASNLGATTLKHHIDASEETVQVTNLASSAGSLHSQLDSAARAYGPGSDIAPIAEVMGLYYDVTVDHKGEKISATGLDDIDELNDRLTALGITDRKFVEYDGARYTTAECVEAIGKGEILLSNDAFESVHDKLFHLMGFVLLSPSVFSVLRSQAQSVASGQKHIENPYQKPEVFLRGVDPDEAVAHYQKKSREEDFMKRLDFDPTSIALSSSSLSESSVQYMVGRMKDIIGSDITDAEALSYAEGTINWINSLRDRSVDLTSID